MSEGMFHTSWKELQDSPPLHIGEMILCPHCEDAHAVEGGRNIDTGEVSEQILFYKCGEKVYVAGIEGKNLMRRFMQ